MGKNQTMKKETESQRQGVCEKIFKALNLSSALRSRNPKSATNSDHHRSDPTKATKFNLVVPQKDQNLSFASNRVLVEYNHMSSSSSVDTEIPKSKTEYPVEMFAATDHLQNQDYNDSRGTGRFSGYIDHVKNKIIMSSNDDDDDDDDDDSESGVGRDSLKIRNNTAIA